jgi:hypothetical protein
VPYALAGQLLTEAGYSSGQVVKEWVVLTAAHAVFNQASMSFVPQALWFFQRHKAEHEPLPQRARGWYVFSGYSNARSNSPAGQSSLEAYQQDVAAVYFLSPAGRGGYGGYVVSDGTKNWLTGPENKLLVGYPVSGKDGLQGGKLYATLASTYGFDLLSGQVYSTTGFRSYPGNSGGAVCVQHTNGNYYPAAVYLGESGPQSIVRLIDTNVVDLLNRAELSAYTGDNNTSGGANPIESPIGGGQFQVGWLAMTLSPAEAVSGGARWYVEGRGVTNVTGETLSLRPASYLVKYVPATGYLTPNARTVMVANAATTNLVGRYYLASELPTMAKPAVEAGGLGMEITAVVAGRYVVEESTDLRAWTPVATNDLTAGQKWTYQLNTSGKAKNFVRVRVE